jgi:CheY-like chemotaxis protein
VPRIRSAVPSAARILLVEDDPALRTTLAELLHDEGYDVVCAEHGAEALTRLGTEPAPSVILLDLAMPVMDGWSFRSVQLEDPRLAAIPTVILSATASADPSALDGLDAAATLPKPFTLERLIATVQRLCPAC